MISSEKDLAMSRFTLSLSYIYKDFLNTLLLYFFRGLCETVLLYKFSLRL